MASRARPVSTHWWGIGLLSLLVAASSFAVPRVLPAKEPMKDEVALPSGSATVSPSASPSMTPTVVPTTTAMVTPTAAPTTASPRPTTTKPRPKPTFQALTINPWAKANETSGIAVIDCPTCASGKRVQYLGQGHYVIVRLKNLRVGGRRTLTVIYTCACDPEERELDIMVNSDPVRTFSVKGAQSWDTPARFSTKIDLVKGDNVIRFFNQNDPAPDLDQILIR
ncbi:hypothetical protein [Kineosporia sp. NBRC 101731]|uniref:hypothetical protein n=1 Tax=Kineosporia sp. NBRC 101731 TaxID=3032199 RepID=UPI0024A57901|nr:hypothetical protein [Kineosporia sp. NBRC 101731]GLY31730.1 hypothetical protein Kisp02_50950 [Kineosporia sp. NBRC 101731]